MLKLPANGQENTLKWNLYGVKIWSLHIGNHIYAH